MGPKWPQYGWSLYDLRLLSANVIIWVYASWAYENDFDLSGSVRVSYTLVWVWIAMVGVVVDLGALWWGIP